MLLYEASCEPSWGTLAKPIRLARHLRHCSSFWQGSYRGRFPFLCASWAWDAPNVKSTDSQSSPDKWISKELIMNGIPFSDQSLRGSVVNHQVTFCRRNCFMRLLPLFKLHEGILYYNQKLCVPRKNVRDKLYLANYCRFASHLSFSKTLARLDSFHWTHKSRDVKYYFPGC